MTIDHTLLNSILTTLFFHLGQDKLTNRKVIPLKNLQFLILGMFQILNIRIKSNKADKLQEKNSIRPNPGLLLYVRLIKKYHLWDLIIQNNHEWALHLHSSLSQRPFNHQRIIPAQSIQSQPPPIQEVQAHHNHKI